jgi:rhomboid protease GluP
MPGMLAMSAIRLFDELVGREFLATKLLGGLCLVTFTLCVLDQGGLGALFANPLSGGFDTSVLLRFGAAGRPGIIHRVLGHYEHFRYLSAVFVHAGILHLLFNMGALARLGTLIEGTLGASRLVVLFTGTGICGFVLSDWYDGPFGRFTVGASGGIFGLLGAHVAILRFRRDPQYKDQLWSAVIMAVVMALVFNTNNAAHAGGLISGLLLGALFAAERRTWRLGPLFSGLGLILLVASVASVFLATRSSVWEMARKEEIERGLRQ